MTEPPKEFRISEAAKMLGVHNHTLHNWDKSGYLKAHRVGPKRERRYYLEDLLRILTTMAPDNDLPFTRLWKRCNGDRQLFTQEAKKLMKQLNGDSPERLQPDMGQW